MKKHLIALTVAGLFSVNALAVAPYLQAQVGQSEIDADIKNDNDTYLGIGLGFGLAENLAVEVGYKDFGEASGSTNNEGVDVDMSIETTSFTVAVVGKLPVGSSAELFGKFGLDIWETDVAITGSGFDISRTWSGSDDGTDFYFAFGAAFNITESTDIHVEYQLHSFEYTFENEDLGVNISDDADIDVITVGVNFGF